MMKSMLVSIAALCVAAVASIGATSVAAKDASCCCGPCPEGCNCAYDGTCGSCGGCACCGEQPA